MTPLAYTGLAAALHAVQSKRGSDLDAHWRLVFAALRTQARMRGSGPQEDDVVQVAAIKIHRATTAFRGASDGEAVRFLALVVRHAFIDRIRRQKAGVLGHIVRPREDTDDEGRGEIIDRVPAPEVDPTRAANAREALSEVLDRLRYYVDESIAAKGVTQARQETLWLQGHAAMLALLEEKGAREIAVALGTRGATPSAIYKWTERGREVVLGALDVWEANTDVSDDDDRRVIATLRELIRARRKDAGRPRPARRKTGGTRERR